MRHVDVLAPARSVSPRSTRCAASISSGFSAATAPSGRSTRCRRARGRRERGRRLSRPRSCITSPWEGFRFYDFIFPLFIFITGVAIVLSLPRLVEREGKAHAHWRVLRRALLLYGLGLIYYGGISPLGRHPLSRRAATHRDLLPVRLADVPELQPARPARRIRGAAGRLLGADDLRAGARNRRRLVSARTPISPTGSTRIICRAACGTAAAIRKAAEHSAGDRHLPDRRVRRPVAAGRAFRRNRNRSG